jgi:hypothetical protein
MPWSMILLIAILLSPLGVSAAPATWPLALIDQRLLSALAKDDQTFWVVLLEKANLAPAYTMKNGDAHGRFVVAQL